MPYRGLRGIELHLSNRHLGVCKLPPVAALRCRRARTPTRAGFHGMLGSRLLARKSICHSPTRRHAHSRMNICCSQHRWWVRRPDNIRTQQPAEGGVPASGACSAKARRATQAQLTVISINWNLTPIYKHPNKLESDPHLLNLTPIYSKIPINWNLTPINSGVRQNRYAPIGAVPPLFVHTPWRCPHDY